LVFPSIILSQYLILRREPEPIGRIGQVMLGLSLLWYFGCLFGLVLPPARRWIATHRAQLGALWLSLAVSFVAAEAICRWQLAPSEPPDFGPRYSEYSPELGWHLIAGVQDIGASGWRNPNYPPERTPGSFRIVCVGDSTTFGTHVNWDEAWPHQLELLLNKDADWTAAHGRTEVLNLGVPGYGPDQSLLVLKKYGLAYAPDLVIFHLCLNDFADASFDHFWGEWGGLTRYKPYYVLKDGNLVLGRDHVPLPRDPLGNEYDPATQMPAAAPSAGFRLALFPFLRDRIHSMLRRDGRKKLLEWPEQYWPIHEAYQPEYNKVRPLVWALLKEMSRVTQAAGIRFMVTLSPTSMETAADDPPWRVASFLREYENEARTAGIPAYQCVAEYFAAGGKARFALPTDPCHLDPAGNALIAQATQRWLRQEYPASKPQRSARSTPAPRTAAEP
jgi:lysophospholipase L1-like esterase